MRPTSPRHTPWSNIGPVPSIPRRNESFVPHVAPYHPRGRPSHRVREILYRRKGMESSGNAAQDTPGALRYSHEDCLHTAIYVIVGPVD